MSRRRARCWCGRGVATDYPDAIECEEHDQPADDEEPVSSDPLTPGGVFGDRPVQP